MLLLVKSALSGIGLHQAIQEIKNALFGMEGGIVQILDELAKLKDQFFIINDFIFEINRQGIICMLQHNWRDIEGKKGSPCIAVTDSRMHFAGISDGDGAGLGKEMPVGEAGDEGLLQDEGDIESIMGMKGKINGVMFCIQDFKPVQDGKFVIPIVISAFQMARLVIELRR